MQLSWCAYVVIHTPPALLCGCLSFIQPLACGLYPRPVAYIPFGPARPQHCPHTCWRGIHGLPKCGSALVTLLLLVCSAGPSTFSRPTSSPPWGWEPSWAPPRAVSFQYIFLSRPGYVALVNYPMGFIFSKCSCISASRAAWIHGISYLALCGGKSPVRVHLLRHLQPWPQRVPHPQTSVCTAWSTRSPARNGWPDTRSLRLPSVCCPQPGTPPAAHVCNACVTRGWACTVCSTRSNCSHFGTRKRRLLRVWYPQPLPAICMTPAANACTVWPDCSSCLQRVQHPQPLVCNAWHPRLVCNLSPAPTLARLHCFWTFRRGLQCTCMLKCQTQWVAWPSSASICLWHQPWRGCIASGHFDEACSALACWSAKLNGLRDHLRPPYVDLRHGCSWSGPAPYHLNLPSVWHLRTPPACSSGSNFQFLCQILTKYRHGGGARAKP